MWVQECFEGEGVLREARRCSVVCCGSMGVLQSLRGCCEGKGVPGRVKVLLLNQKGVTVVVKARKCCEIKKVLVVLSWRSGGKGGAG